jgi:hypothetical protein
MTGPPIQPKIIQNMFDRALAAATMHDHLLPGEMRQGMEHGDCYECEAVRRELVREIAEYLAGRDPDLRAIYRYDPTFASGEDARTREMPSESAAIYLLAWTSMEPSPLDDEAARLAQAFADARARWLCPKAIEWCYAVNIVVVDDYQVKARQGYAALINSVWVRPTRVWASPSLN